MTSVPHHNASNRELTIYPSYCHNISPTFHKWVPLLARDVFALREVDGFQGQDIYFYQNHPIKYVKLSGIVIALDEFTGGKNSGWIVITVDDSSGIAIECTCAAPPKDQSSGANEEAKELKGSSSKSTAATEISKVTSNPEATIQKQPQEIDDGKSGFSQSPDGPYLHGIAIGTVVKVKGGLGMFRGSMQVRMKRIEILRETNKEVSAWKEIVQFRKDVLSEVWVVTEGEEEACKFEQQKREEQLRVQEDERRKAKKDSERKLRKEEERRKRKHSAVNDGTNPERRYAKPAEDNKRKSKESIRAGPDPENKVNFPSKAVRLRAAGKYDALGI